MNDNSKFTIYIEKLWISGDTCLNNILNAIERLQAKSYISKKREEFVERLKNEGFNVTCNKEDINEDTICLIMDNTAICDLDVEVGEYKKLFDKKIFESAGEHFYYPISLRIEEYFNNPFFPAVFKNELANGGEDKFLIETPEQLEVIKRFYNKHSNDPKYKVYFDCTIFQQFLETPGKYASYIRVLVGGSGEVMGASLKYSVRTSPSSDLNGLFENVFLNPNSEYYINAKKMFNYYSGGQNISFSQPRFSDEKTEVLLQHGFDPNNLVLPTEVLEVCKNIMENCNRELGVLCGIDFMLNASDKKWYYLENQAFPAIEEWAQAKKIYLPKVHNIKDYLKLLEIEMQTRYEALMLLVNKRKNDTKVKINEFPNN